MEWPRVRGRQEEKYMAANDAYTGYAGGAPVHGVGRVTSAAQILVDV